MAEWGAFAFGLVLGWFVYYTNRYRRGEVQLSDLTTLLGVIGGGAVTALFGEAKTRLFGAYGLGLASGFFGYFITLLVLVRRSKGVFTATWFLDGRRKKVAEDEEIPGEVRATVAPMAVRAGGPQRSMLAPTKESVMVINEKYYCSCLTEGALTVEDKKLLLGHKAALLKDAKWNVGSVITVRFLEGSAALQQRVREVAEEWTTLANVSLDFRSAGPTDVRIAFVAGNGSWSYLGRMCRHIPEPRPSMNYGWLTDDSPQDEVRRVVLHEFGHALGLIHEHQNPKGGGIDWNRDAVASDLSGPPNNWDPATIEENMFKKYAVDSVVATEVDSLSIMMYPIPRAWTLDGTSAGLNSELSAKDRAFIAENYPK